MDTEESALDISICETAGGPTAVKEAFRRCAQGSTYTD